MFSPKKSGMERVKAITDKFNEMLKEIEQGITEMLQERTEISVQIDRLTGQKIELDLDIDSANKSYEKIKALV